MLEPVSSTIPLLLLLLLGLLAGLLFVRLRRSPRAPIQPRRLFGRLMRLAGMFGLTLLLVLLGLMVYTDYQTVLAETATAFSAVDLPPGLPFALEEVSFDGGPGVRLAGWYAPPSTQKGTLILLHGYGGARTGMLWHAQVLVEAGYGVLLYDERASGESSGARRSYGWEDGPDVGGAVAFIQERSGQDAPVGIAGSSTGGQIALQGAILYPQIVGVWADGPSNLRAADGPPVTDLPSGLLALSSHLLDWMYVQRLGIPAPTPLVERIGQIDPRPLMLVGGGVEVWPFGSEAQRVRHYASHAGGSTQVWVIEEATHCDGPERRPEAYARRMVEFFDLAFQGD